MHPRHHHARLPVRPVQLPRRGEPHQREVAHVRHALDLVADVKLQLAQLPREVVRRGEAAVDRLRQRRPRWHLCRRP